MPRVYCNRNSLTVNAFFAVTLFHDPFSSPVPLYQKSAEKTIPLPKFCDCPFSAKNAERRAVSFCLIAVVLPEENNGDPARGAAEAHGGQGAADRTFRDAIGTAPGFLAGGVDVKALGIDGRGGRAHAGNTCVKVLDDFVDAWEDGGCQMIAVM